MQTDLASILDRVDEIALRRKGIGGGDGAHLWAAGLEVRFWSKVRLPNSEGCMEWIGAKNLAGYGKLNFRSIGKTIDAHRVSYELAYGVIPPGLFVLHLCDNTSCVRPDHLLLGTQAENLRDCRQKGRSRDVPLRGEANGNSSLTAEDVLQIRRLKASGLRQKDIARQFGITPTHVGHIVQRKVWTHLPEEPVK